MELARLKTFLAVVRTGNLSAGIGTTDAIIEHMHKFNQQYLDIQLSFLSSRDIFHFQIGKAD